MFRSSGVIAISALALLLAACTPKDDGSTPLPTKEKTIDRVQKGLDDAQREAERRREEAEKAANQ